MPQTSIWPLQHPIWVSTIGDSLRSTKLAAVYLYHIMILKREDRAGVVVKSSHWCQEVLGSSSLSAIIAGVRLARENPPPDPT
jgi:hypothetical protein